MAMNKRENLVSMLAVPRVDDHVETNASERGVRTEAMNSHMKDVDVFGGEDSGQLMQKARLVVKPGAEREVATR